MVFEEVSKETEPKRSVAAGSDRTANPAVGVWRLDQPTLGKSDLEITEAGGKLTVLEIGQGGAKSTVAACEDGLLVIHWRVHDGLRGYWVINLNDDYSKKTGKTVFIRSDDFTPGQAAEIEGRKVRIVKDVTIERASGKRSFGSTDLDCRA